jgi:hypothetical protein
MADTAQANTLVERPPERTAGSVWEPKRAVSTDGEGGSQKFCGGVQQRGASFPSSESRVRIPSAALVLSVGPDALVAGVTVTITGCDSQGVLEQALSIALNFQPMSIAEHENLLARTADAAQGGKWEKFQTTHQFDGTVQNVRWLTSAQI